MTVPAHLWVHLPLAQAYLCPDCDSIGNLPQQCPACGNPAVLSLAQVLKARRRREESFREKAAVVAVGAHALEEQRQRCTVCGGAEGTMTTECPGERLSREEEDMIWAGVLDFRAGTWERLKGTEEI